MNKNSVPEICRVSPYLAGETAQIYGENLEDSVLYWWQPETDTDTLTFKENIKLPDVPPAEAIALQPTDYFKHVMYIQMQGTEKERLLSGCAVIWLRNEAGFSKPFIANSPEIWSTSLSTVRPGDRLAMFGSNFNFFGRKKCVLIGKGLSAPINLFWGCEAEHGAEAPNTAEFKCECRIPDILEDGEYQIRIHCGTCGEYGWSNPYTVFVKNEETYIEYCNKKWNFEPELPHTFDMSRLCVRRVSCRYADGLTDAGKEIQTAIDEASAAGGGIVMLPNGIFGVTETLILKPNVVLKGAGRGATTLTVLEGSVLKKQLFPVKYAAKKGYATQWAADWKPLFEARMGTPLVLIHTDAGMEDLRIEDSNGAFATVMVANTESDLSKNVFLNRVDINEAVRYNLVPGEGYNPSYCVLTVGHTENFTMFKCNIIGANPLFMLHAKHYYAHLIGNTFEVCPRQLTEVSINGAYNCMIEQNSFVNGRRTLMCQSAFNCNWVYQNRGTGVHRCGNALEAYMCELGGGPWVGKAETVLEDGIATSVDFENHYLEYKGRQGTVGENFDDHTTFLCIIGGRGLGQYRMVDRVEKNRIYLSEKWDILPDDTTDFAFIFPGWHNLWVNNNQEMSGGHSQFFYGSGLENIIAGHQMVLSAGIMCQSNTELVDDKIVEYGLLSYNRFVNCETRACGKAIDLRTSRYDLKKRTQVREGQPEIYNETMSMWGNIFRGNVFGGSSDLYYVKNQLTWRPVEDPYCMDIGGAFNIFEGNHIFDFDKVFNLYDIGEGNYFNKNNIINAKQLFGGKGVPIGPYAENNTLRNQIKKRRL